MRRRRGRSEKAARLTGRGGRCCADFLMLLLLRDGKEGVRVAAALHR